MGIDWPDVPGLPDFPDLPSPGEVMENLLRSLSGGMKVDAESAVRATLGNIASSGGPDFMDDWLRLMFSMVFGLALAATIMLSLPIIVVQSMSRDMNAAERMIHTFTQAVKLLFLGYFMLPMFSIGFYIADVLTKAFNQINAIGGTSPLDNLSALFSTGGVASVFGDLVLSGLIMIAGGFLYVYLELIEYGLVPLALLMPLAYAVKQINIWGYRFWKLYVAFVGAVMFTTPVVVLIISVASQVAAHTTAWNSTVQGVFLLVTLGVGAAVPGIIMLLTYVGYTVQVGKSESRVEGKVQTMPLEWQYKLYGRQTADRVNQMLAVPSAVSQSYRPQKDKVMRSYIRSAASNGVDLKIHTATTALATKAGAAIGGPMGAGAAVMVHAAGNLASKKSRRAMEGGQR